MAAVSAVPCLKALEDDRSSASRGATADAPPRSVIGRAGGIPSCARASTTTNAIRTVACRILEMDPDGAGHVDDASH